MSSVSSVSLPRARRPSSSKCTSPGTLQTFSLCPDYPHALAGKDFYEVSCGHMGGLDWFAKAHPELASVRGLDFAPADVDDPRVVKGDAQDMPLEDACLDIIMNVEVQ